jgi:hypothetical protein
MRLINVLAAETGLYRSRISKLAAANDRAAIHGVQPALAILDHNSQSPVLVHYIPAKLDDTRVTWM